MTAKPTLPLWAATPNEEESGGRVALDARVSGGLFIPFEGPFALLDLHAEIPLAVRPQTGIEIGTRLRVALLACDKENPSKHLDRMLGQVGLTQMVEGQLVVANDVPPVQSVLISQVRYELGHGHSSSCPRDDTLGVHLEDFGYQLSHPLFFGIEAIEKVCVVHRLERSFAHFKAASLRDGGTLKEWIEMAIHFHRDARDMRGDFMGRPSIA
jgi:hypothetical protein